MSITFKELGLNPNVLSAVNELGYEEPTPVQAQSIPILLKGHDLLAQAQTGTGKTAAFALPILSDIDLGVKQPQAIVIAPTRELAIQVAEAFQSYAKHLKGFNVVPIYGGQDYQIQLRALKRGAHVIVGTPGRVMDHLRRGTLKTDTLKTIVLDEADIMLKMGFIDDVEWILEQIPTEHRTALFSATLPASIKNIAKRYLNNPEKVHIEPKESTVGSIEQVCMRVSGKQKLEALTRFLEVEEMQGAIIFVRTKNGSEELAEKLQARGYAVSALNGDMQQAMRKRVITQMKNEALDIIVATDVAARGIDIERISHVINFDISHDVESYIHRIGRTGRAGRKGKALLFVGPREQRLLKEIERTVGKPIVQIEPPTLEEMNEIRSKQLAEKVVDVIKKSKHLKPYYTMVKEVTESTDCSPNDIAAALAYLLQQSNPISTQTIDSFEPEAERSGDRRDRGRGRGGDSRGRGRPSGGGYKGRSSDSRGKPRGKPSGSRSRSSDSEEKGSGRGRSSDKKFGDKKFGEKRFDEKKSSDKKFGNKKFAGKKATGKPNSKKRAPVKLKLGAKKPSKKS